MTRLSRSVVGLFLTVAVLLLCFVAHQPLRAHLEALAVMTKAAGHPVPWIARQVTRPVAQQDLSVPMFAAAGQQQVRARLYVPAGAFHPPAMVIFHGVHHLGIDEPRLVSFATAIASCGIEVLTPELPDIKDYRVSEASITTIGDSVNWFARQTGHPVGVMGLSFSGGLALVAAADPLYEANFKFVMAVGSQYSMARVTEYYRTNSDLKPDGSVQLLTAHEYGPLVLEYEYLDDFLPKQDVAAVREVLRAHLYEDKQAEAQASLALSETQKREALELMDATSSSTRSRIAAAAEKHAGQMLRLSPGGRLNQLRTPVYLLHGEADNIIPSAETLWTASELPPEHLKGVLVSPVLSHLDLDGAGPGVSDQWRLLHFFAAVMQAASAPAARPVSGPAA